MPETPDYFDLGKELEQRKLGSVPDGEAWTPGPSPEGFPPEPEGDDPRDAGPPFFFGEKLGILARRPLIFVPGIMGTKLEMFDYATKVTIRPVWPPLNVAGPSTRPLTYLQTLTKRPSTTGNNPLVDGAYDRLISFLTWELKYQLGKNFFIFGYDWTRSNLDSGRKLAGLVEWIKATYQWPPGTPESDKQVDVICHSMGGLVTRAAIRLWGAPVARTIYLASPHYGAPQALGAVHPAVHLAPWVFDVAIHTIDWYFGLHLGNLTAGSGGGIDATLKRIVLAMPAVFELLPDAIYFQRDASIADVLDMSSLPMAGGASPLLQGYSKPVSGLSTTYFNDPSTRFRDAVHTDQAERAMSFKKSLGPGLPGGIFCVLASLSKSTDNFVHFATWTEDQPAQSGALIAHGKTSHGDGTVPFISAKGPAAYIVVRGSHTEVPETRQTHYWIARFLKATA